MFCVGFPYGSICTGPRGASVMATLRRAAMKAGRSSTLPPIARTASLMIRAPV